MECPMISLNVYLTPKAGRAAELERAIVDSWIAAMARQPGFLWAAMNTAYADAELAALAAAKPAHAYEVVAYWNSEKERAEWVARDIHQEVWPKVAAQAERISYTLFNCDRTWGK
jgi:hypothetical protein